MISTLQTDFRNPGIQFGNTERPDIDFRRPRLIEDDFRLLGVGEKFMSGIFQGFTTINLSRREPANVAEGIALSLGTWLGITGVAFSGPKAWGARFMAQGASRGGRMATGMAKNNFRSVPIWVGDKAVQGIRNMSRQINSPAMRDFARTHSYTVDALEGATRIGTAMGLVSWQEGIEAMAMGGALGVLFGGSDRVIGNVIRDLRPALRQQLNIPKTASPGEVTQRLRRTERAISAVSAGIVSGMPSTIMGQPMEYQIYDYLFGAWLGAEPSYVMRTSHGMINQARSNNRHMKLLSEKMRSDTPEYRKMVRDHKNERVREMINEELNAQADFYIGQRINNHNKMPVMVATADAAAKAGKASLDEVLEMNRHMFAEGVEGAFIQEGLARYQSEAEGQGMGEKQAEVYAMDRIREEYFQWRSGEETPEFMRQWSESIEVFSPGKKDYQLYRPVQVGDEVGIISQVDSDGSVMRVLASDGVELVRNKTVRSSDQIASDRARQNDVHNIDRQDVVNKIVAWRYKTDDTNQFVNQGEGAEKLVLDDKVWEYFPDLEANYKQPSFHIDADGKFYPSVLIAGKEYHRLPFKFDKEQDAYRFALDYLTTTSRERALNQDPSALYETSIIKRLAEEYSKPGHEIKSRPILEITADIIRDLDIKDQLRDHTELYSNPFTTYQKIVQSLVKTRDTQRRNELVKELAKAEKDQSPQRQQRIDAIKSEIDGLTDVYRKPLGWKGFLAEMNNQFPMKRGDKSYWDMSNPVVRDLRRWYKDMSLQKPTKSLVMVTRATGRDSQGRVTSREGKLEQMDVMPTGQRNVTYKAPSLLQKALWELSPMHEVIHIDHVYDQTSNQVTRLNQSEIVTRENINRYLDRMYSRGELSQRYYVASGVKDKDTLRAIPYLFDTPANARDYLQRRANRMKGLASKERDFSIEIQKMLDTAEPREIMQYASNMKLWEKLNHDSVGTQKVGSRNKYRFPIEFMTNQQGFINTVAAMNKRLQIMDAEGMRADAEFYTNPDGSQKTEFKTMIVDVLADVEGVDPFLRPGSESRSRADQHGDGAVLVSQRTFDQMVLDGGLDPQTGAIKGVTAFSDIHGAFLGKYAMFRASDKADAFMRENDIDFLHNTTTVKQPGERSHYNLKLNKDGKASLTQHGKPVKSPQTYAVPIDGVTINAGQSEHPGAALGRQGLPVQMMQTFSPHVVDKAVADATIKQVLNQSNQTRGKAKEILTKVEAMDMLEFDAPVSRKLLRDMRKEVAEIDIHDLSTRDLFQILQGDPVYTETGLYDAVIRQMHKHRQQTLADNISEGFDDAGISALSNEFSSQLDYLLQIRSAADQPLTPFELNQRGLRNYADTVYRNFIVSRTMRPQLDYSLKSIGSSQDPWFLQEFGRVEKGEFMLGQGAKKMKIRVGDRDMALGKAFDELQTVTAELADIRSEMVSLEKAIARFKGKEGKAQADLRRSFERLQHQEIVKSLRHGELTQAMDMIVTRVPIEHASGVRSLKFKGFTNERGVTSKLNPDDMANLGGMDLDIDSVFIFQNLGKTKHKTADGQMRSMHDELRNPKSRDYWYDKQTNEFIDPKSTEMQQFWDAVYDKSQNPHEMFVPDKLFEAGRATAEANASLGLIVNARRDLLAMLDGVPTEKFTLSDMDLSPAQHKVLSGVFGKDASFEFKARQGADRVIDEIARAGINMSADAADLTRFIDKFTIKSKMHEKAYEFNLKKPKKVKQKDYDKALSILRSNSPSMKRLQKANQALSGRIGEYTSIDAPMMLSYLRRLDNEFSSFNAASGNGDIGLKDLHGSYYHSIAQMIDTNFHYKPLSDINMQGLNRFYEKVKGFLDAKTSIRDEDGKLVTPPKKMRGSKLATYFRSILKDITGAQRRIYKTAYTGFVKDYNEAVRAFNKGDGDIMDLKIAHDNLTEIIANDFNDVTSALVLYREAHNLMVNGFIREGKKVKLPQNEVMTHIQNIFNKASALKTEIYFIKNPDARPADYPPRRNLEAIEAEWKRYRKGLPEGLRKFADFAGMSTFFRARSRAEFLKSLTPSQKKKMSQAEIQRQMNLSNVKTSHLHQAEFMKHAKGDHINEFFMTFRNVSELSAAPEGKSLDSFNRLQPEVRLMFEKMIVDATDGESNYIFPYDYQDRPAPPRIDMRIDQIKKTAGKRYKPDSKPAYLNENDPTYNSLLAQHTRAMKSLNKYLQDGGEFKLSAEEMKLWTDLRDLFIRHPQIANNFDLIFSGELGITRRDTEFVKLEDGVMDHLRQFMAAARGHYHGDLLKPPTVKDKIPKWMYWMVPDKYHRTYANIDLQLDPVMIPTAEGGMTQGLVISSPAKRLTTWANNIQLGIEIRNQQMAEEFSTIMDDMVLTLGDDFDTLWRYTVLKRKVERGQPSKADLQMYENLTAEMARIQTEYYSWKGKNISKMDAVDALDGQMTKANQAVWKIVHNPDQPKYYYKGTQKWVDSKFVIAKMEQSFLADDITKLWIPDTWTLNNMVLQQYVHSKIKASMGKDTPEIGSQAWLAAANTFIKNADMQAALEMPSLPFDSYYPQRNHSKEALKQWRIEQKKRDRALTMDQKREQQYAAMRLVKDYGYLNSLKEDAVLADIIGLDPAGITPAEYNTGASQLAGHLRQRSDPADQIPDWDPGVRSYIEYMNSLVKNNYNKALSLVGANQIDNAEIRMREAYGKKASHYADFLRLYLSDQVMTQTMVPTTWANNYASLNLKSSGYYYFTDRYFTELDQKISKMLGTKPLLADNDPLRPLRLSEIANLEAKYSLMTLLSRPKTGIMNLYGGTTILASDIGVSNAMKGWSLREIQKVNPSLRTWNEAMKFADVHGAMESLIRYEVMQSPGWRNRNTRKAFTKMLDAIKKDPTVSDLTLTEIATRYGLSDTVMNAAAFPMKYSERILRTRSFFAHYIKAVNSLEVTGPSAANHPWALHMAKRGVATTQFLYNNAHRPAFARSNVGKIFSRFKMWAITSVKFRADAFNEMAGDLRYNVQDPATHKRFNDIMMMDMFMIALAGLYPFSVFGNAIPEPWSWMNELVKWAFGDREEAFRGGSGLPTSLAPLAVTLPPSSRAFTSWIDPVVRDDWGTFTGYQVWTLFPFGLLARDTRNAIRTPERAIDRLTGLPVGEAVYSGRSPGRSKDRTPAEEVLPMVDH